ncbi:HNH endonuclease [Metabacillus sp. JX24]|uniref:HNH endonuclease n=1 Tax=Metabacillus sp. JX24 TaxID=3240759 RepID=UPI00350FA496
MILSRDKNVCAYCGNYGETIDHIVPRSQGGLSLFSNCVCCCKRCNSEKGNRFLSEFFNDISRFDEETENELLTRILGRT